MTIFVAGGTLSAISNVSGKAILLPYWAWLIIGIIALVVAQFLVYHNVRKQRDSARNEIAKLKQENTTQRIPTLYIEAHVEGFGHPYDDGYPPSDDNTILWIRIYLRFNVFATVLVESVTLDILGNHIPDLNWKSMEVSESQPIGYVYFALPSTITPRQHSAKILAFAEGEWRASKPFPVDVPKR
jgi:hypothetical protein